MPKVVVTDAKGLVQESGAGVEFKGAEDGTAPTSIALASADGTLFYIFFDNNGDIKVHSAAPTANGDGTKPSAQ